MSSHPRTQRGFTLLSVLIAISMLTLGLMALARTQTALVRAQSTTAARAAALAIAQGYVEVLRSRDTATLVSEAAVAVDGLGQPSPQGRFGRSTVVTTDAPNLRRVVVQVSYPRSLLPIELTTLIFRRTP